ncbi:disease resistance protein TAO1-like [Coffea eugenioides]|uniref:disease resistance protein TAO1-like n=1 Tax=Coffea eugenioides TaxID=49369 RepID=UPI000F606DAB|nr:disease resistance protein TAO1-like [Coffea eugenioides]
MEEEEEDQFSRSTPSALRLRWDVFLSFRGEDTRDNFTDRLYSALDTSGVRVFRDNNGLTQGDQIDRGLVEAIEDSAAAIAIISDNYASSRWCLEELAHIFQSPRLVLPVFYRVDPSDVRRQRGPFEEDFKALEERFGVQKVVRWRKAMERVGGISGWVYNNSEESDLIQNIVKRILAELSNSPVVVASYVVGLDFCLEELVELLDVKQNGQQVLGLHGLGGIGKTTLAKALYNKLARHFQCRSFLSSVRENFKSRQNGPEFLQKKIVGDLSSHKVPPTFSDAKSYVLEMKRILKQNRVLLVLDDIDDAGQLKELAGSREWYSEGSRIVITTRDAAVLPTDFVDKIYEVKSLGKSESLKLFSHHAFRRENPTGAFLNLSKEIVSCTGGLPLALEVFGSLLYGKRIVEEWQDALAKLKQIRGPELQGALKISYDALDVQERSIFLDIACLFLNLEMNREDVIDALRGSYFGVETAITTLVSRSLIKFIDSEQLWMHDQIRDMGRQIIVEENLSDVYGRSRIWNPADVLGLFQDGKGTRDIQGIVLDLEKKNFPRDKKARAIAWQQLRQTPNFTSAVTYFREIYKEHHHRYATKDGEVILNATSFESMVNLRLLQFSNVKLEGHLKRLPAQLKWLQWRKCSLRSLPSDFFPRELAVLDLSESKIERIWGRKWCWHAQQNVMNLRHCNNITEIPDLSGYEKLEKLILERCTKLEKIHQSMGDLRSLRHLNLNHCLSLVEFPEDVSGLKNVEILTLSGCTKLRSLPKNIECMISLRVLLLDDTVIGHLPENIFRLTKLEKLSLERCSSLKRLPRHVGKLISLREISLYHSALEEIPASFGSLRSLETLDLMWCRSLTVIPESVGNLKSLTKFYLSGSSVKLVPSSIGYLYYLKELSLGKCFHIKMLPASIEGLSSLTELQLDDMQITGLPDQIGALISVKKLEMRNCKLLSSLPDSIGKMLALEKLIITNAAITELPVSIGSLENLFILRLNKCKNLQRLPDSFGDLRNLRHLLMEETAMTELPETFGKLLNLMILKMAKKPDGQLAQSSETIDPVINVEREAESILLPPSFSKLISLEEFDARAWKISGQLPDNFEKLTSLKILNLSHNDFFSLPSSMSGLSVLRELFLSSCSKLKALPPLPSSLLNINASNCIALESIHSLSNLTCLQDLNLSNCGKLVDVPGIECLKSLRRLHMVGCTSCAQAVRKIDKVALKNLGNLSFPGSEVPEWLTSDVVSFSKRKNISLKAVIIGFVISVDCGGLVDSRHQLPVVPGVNAKILRLNETVHTSGMFLAGVPRTDEDQTYLCRYEDYHPLVSILKDGDKIEVGMQNLSIFEGLQLKKRGIHLIFENDDDYDGDEESLDQSQQSISERLRRFIGSPRKGDLITGSRGENKQELQKHVSDCFQGILGYAKYKPSLIVLISLILGIAFAWWLKV